MSDKKASIFLKSILTGLAIGIGGTVYLSCDNKYIGAVLFGTGLFVILTFGFYLFTGKVGYLVGNKPSYITDLMIVWMGNFFGTYLTAMLIRQTRISDISFKASAICDTKLNDTGSSILILSFFCGMLMFIAADGYKNNSTGIEKTLAIFLPVTVFILCGFEHCVANMFYFTLADKWSPKAAGYMLIMTTGNSLGGITIPIIRKLTKGKSK